MVKPFVSDTRSPMVYAARRVKEQYPDAEVVFIGPCLAKRYEAEMYVPEVDYVMSFEELGAFMVAYDINPETCEDYHWIRKLRNSPADTLKPVEFAMLL